MPAFRFDSSLTNQESACPPFLSRGTLHFVSSIYWNQRQDGGTPSSGERCELAPRRVRHPARNQGPKPGLVNLHLNPALANSTRGCATRPVEDGHPPWEMHQCPCTTVAEEVSFRVVPKPA